MREDGIVSWGTFTDDFIDELVDWIDDRTVLEIFAGNGLLASLLSAKGIDIIATSQFSSHDGHERGMLHTVEEMSAADAVGVYGPGRDILLRSWPTATRGAFHAISRWVAEKPIVFIGETTNKAIGHLAGCADDDFFEVTDEVGSFSSYRARNSMERASVRLVDPGRLASCERRIDPLAFMTASRNFGR